METKIIHPDEIDEAVKAIKAGELVSFPTETVYGLGADATNEQAVKNVYKAKGRPSDNPLIIHVSEIKQILTFVENFSKTAQKLMDTFWPGPLTLIFPLKNEKVLPSVVTGGLQTAAFRMPNNQLTLSLIEKSGKVLVGPSANTSGLPSPTTAEHVYHDLAGKIFGVLDGGACQVGVESTVLDLSQPDVHPTILRPGAITKNQLEEVIGTVLMDQHILSEKEAPKAPGMKYKHYSPKTPVIMIDYLENNWQEAIDFYRKSGKKIGLLANKELLSEVVNYEDVYILSENRNVTEAMHHLFAGLRYLDEKNPVLDIILAETYSEKDEGLAYMNRLKKASNQKKYQKEVIL